jgi:ribosomal protein S18 acetylase RimI-like enzyme
MKRNTSSIHIRMAVEKDAVSIASVLYEAFAEYTSAYTHQAFTATTPTSDQIQQRLNEGPVWVAVHKGTIVGTVSAVLQGAAFYIRSMAVLPTARGVGIGALLLDHIEHSAAAHGAGYLVLSTTPFLTRAIRLYEHVGFQRSPDGPHELYGTPLFTMMKPLEPSA